jgi:hypothetical protein
MSFARGSTCLVIPPQVMARVIASRKHFINGQQRKHKTCHQATQQPRATTPRPTPESSKEERQCKRHKGKRKRGERSQPQRPRVEGHATTSKQRTTVNSLSYSLESETYHNVFASGILTFQVRSCWHSTLHSKVFKKHSVNTSTIRRSTRATQTNQ